MKQKTEYPTWDILSFRDLLDGVEMRYPDNIAYLWRDPATESGYAERTYAEAVRDVKALAVYLCAMGLEGKAVAVIGKSSYLWEISFLAVACGCGVAVPLDRELRADELSAVLADAECSAVLYGEDMQEKMAAVSLPGLLKLSLANAEDYLRQGGALRDLGNTAYENHVVDANAKGILLYTSGTVALSKTVVLSQYNVCSNITSVCKRIRITEEDRALSHLPLHHVYACMADLALLYSGASIAFNDSLRRMPSDLATFRPTLLVTVPAVLEFIAWFVKKGYAEARGGRALFGVQSAATGIVRHTVGLFSRQASAKRQRAIFSTVHSFLGGRLRAIMVGAAPLSSQVFSQLEQYGYAVYLGYGLTESAPICLMHDDQYRSSDDIGFPIPGVEVKIDEPNEDGIGELCVKGPNIMLGYYKNDEATSEALRDGWLFTGDLVQKTRTGAYRIVGRNKSVITLSNGKKVLPEELEHYLLRDALVTECLVYAEEKDGEQQLCAAVFPNADALICRMELPENTDLTQLSDEEIARARAILADTVRYVNDGFPPYKHIKKIVVRRTPFVKTSTLKIKRYEDSL
ncbi:MAG: AMP-binding protein [Clostridia bacterium]|nr:AMP-binding protein [Clostridia bacterium]